MDDGFWEGELDGRIGVFPSLVVELLQEEEEELQEKDDEKVRQVFGENWSKLLQFVLCVNAFFFFFPRLTKVQLSLPSQPIHQCLHLLVAVHKLVLLLLVAMRLKSQFLW